MSDGRSTWINWLKKRSFNIISKNIGLSAKQFKKVIPFAIGRKEVTALVLHGKTTVNNNNWWSLKTKFIFRAGLSIYTKLRKIYVFHRKIGNYRIFKHNGVSPLKSKRFAVNYI